VEREKAKQAIVSASGKNNDKAALRISSPYKGNDASVRKVAGAEYFAGKSQHIGVF
jgi:hypothetical protein